MGKNSKCAGCCLNLGLALCRRQPTGDPVKESQLQLGKEKRASAEIRMSPYLLANPENAE